MFDRGFVLLCGALCLSFVLLVLVCCCFCVFLRFCFFYFFCQAEDGIRDWSVTGVQTCALPISFSVAASGTGPLAYQWRFSSAAIAGATGQILVVPSVQPGDAGDYDVTISNLAGAVTSPDRKSVV